MTPHFERNNRTAPRQNFAGGQVGHGGKIEAMDDEPGFLARLFGKGRV